MADEIQSQWEQCFDLRLQIFALVHRPELSSIEQSLQDAEKVAHWVSFQRRMEAHNG